MTLILNVREAHAISAADRNVYATPVPHPTRKLCVHDLIYLTEGEWEVGFAGNVYTMKKDDVLILPANLCHFGVKPCAPGTQTMFIHASCESLDGYSTTELRERNAGNTVCLRPLTHTGENPEVKRLFASVLEAFKQNRAVKASAYFTLLLSELSEYRRYGDKRQTLAYEIQRILDSHIRAHISNREIAERLGLSQRTVETAFKSCFHITVHQYCMEEKLRLAERELVFFPRMKVMEIAANLGFYDEYHFSRAFKKRFGASPTEYRRNAANVERVTCL